MKLCSQPVHTCQSWSSPNRKKYNNCFLKIGINALKYGETNNASKFQWPCNWVYNMLQIKMWSEETKQANGF